MPLRIGMIGCGRFARFYHVPALLRLEHATLTAICDPDGGPELAALAAKAGATRVPAITDLLSPDICDAVIVSSPHTLHFGHVKAAIEAGRHVLVDKPFVMTTAEAVEAVAVAERGGMVAGVAFNRRLDPGCVRARQRLREGALGEIRYVETVQLGYPDTGWIVDPLRGGGGPFVGRGAHMADLVPWLVGRDPVAVSATVKPGNQTRVDHGGQIALGFDGFECRMTCIDSGLNMWDEVRLFGEDGLIELRRPLGMAIGWELVRYDRRGQVVERLDADPGPGACTCNFIAAIRREEALVCSFREALTSVCIIESACASAAADGRRIRLAWARPSDGAATPSSPNGSMPTGT